MRCLFQVCKDLHWACGQRDPRKSISSSVGIRNPVAHPTAVILLKETSGFSGQFRFLNFKQSDGDVTDIKQ